jgi:hypothetical protein
MFSVFPRSPRTVVYLALALHLTYLLAMFDTFFHSPIVQVDVHHEVQAMDAKEPLADRVVLLVGKLLLITYLCFLTEHVIRRANFLRSFRLDVR